MNESDFLAERFEAHRDRLRSVAYRMLGSLSEADDAIQEAWLRLRGAEEDEIENLGGWLTAVVARVSVDMLRARDRRREAPFDQRTPEPIIDSADGTSPEHEALLGDSVGIALLVVLETLNPAERLAFVLHDVFGVPYEEIASIVERSPAAARQLASRARRRVRQGHTETDADTASQREIVNAFAAAAREGDFEALLELLDPDVVLRTDLGGVSRELRGAEAVMSRAKSFARLDLEVRPALVNGVAGVITMRDGELFAVGAYTIANRRIVAMDFLTDPEKLREADFTELDG